MKLKYYLILTLLFTSFTFYAYAEQSILPRHVKKQVTNEFKQLTQQVNLLVFSQQIKCAHCVYNENLINEVASNSKKIKVEIIDFKQNKLYAQNYKVEKIPVTIPIGKKDYGLRFFGIPAGYEFFNLIEAIKDVSRGTTDLDEATIKRLEKIKKPVHIQVLVTPTCPLCTEVVRLAHQFAIHSDYIKADAIELSAFPYLVQKYNVEGVPKTIINEKIELLGPISKEIFLQSIEKVGL
ncbi:MAG: thioredoxin family protein [Candidatus Margulisbacteria bacterium]|nr:thioredoxin family protein [Candidatus Margulisiibacteriota bacterium]